ncbi:MAG: glyoxalase/bleomycin resistance/dioxygenase family protein [Thermoleophilia bacterium]
MSPDAAPYDVRLLFHPTNVVRDRAEMARFLKRVFNANGRNQGELLAEFDLDASYPPDYSLYTWIAEVWIDSIQPELYVLEGQPLPEGALDQRLVEFGWYIDGIDELQKALTTHGIRSVDQNNRPVPPDEAPASAGAPDIKLMWTDPATTGLSYELIEWPRERDAEFARLADARFDPSWTLPPISAEDPLGIERCSHHTILTRDVPRALNLVVDVLGGSVVRTADNPLLGTRSTYVWLKDALLEYAEPVETGSPAATELDGTTTPSLLGMPQEDRYHLIAWKVRDLDAVAAHLAAQGVGVEGRDDHTIVTDPADCLGVRWGFTDSLVTGDPRRGD